MVHETAVHDVHLHDVAVNVCVGGEASEPGQLPAWSHVTQARHASGRFVGVELRTVPEAHAPCLAQESQRLLQLS